MEPRGKKDKVKPSEILEYFDLQLSLLFGMSVLHIGLPFGTWYATNSCLATP